MFGFLKSKSDPSDYQECQVLEVHSPAEGTLVNLSEVPDPVFSRALMGPGFGVDISSGNIVSPIDGEIVTVMETRHAVGIRSESGIEVLVHVGIDTVSLKGDGLTAHVTAGQKVSVGDPLISVDIDTVKGKVPSLITPVIATNADPAQVQLNLENAGACPMTVTIR